MLVIIIEDQLLLPHQICTTCLLADQGGQPRWEQGQLRCGQAIASLSKQLPQEYECQMGFRIIEIE